jgi:hypothetical protein
MKLKRDPFFTKNWHGHSEALRRPYKKVRRNNDRAAIEEGENDGQQTTGTDEMGRREAEGPR